MSNASHHEVFKKFNAFQGCVDKIYEVDFIGTRTHSEILPYSPNRITEIVKSNLPIINEEYFEWIDILEAVDSATDRFTMLEVGAGFGRWAARAGVAALRRNIPFYLGLIEAEPAHLTWINSHMANNNIDKKNYQVFRCAVGGEDGETLFYVAMPEGSEKNTPAEWYGQAVTKDYEKEKSKSLFQKKNKYYGHKVIEFKSGWKAIKVKQMKLSQILKENAFEKIDICDFDIQGNEAIVIRESINHLNNQVKRLHIGTHSHEIEEELLTLLSANGWELIRNYPCLQENETEYGRISFVDGVQTWINSRNY